MLDILQTPFLFQSLGIVSALSLFISPVLYNGDYKAATKTIVVVGGYAFFVALLEFFHLSLREHKDVEIWIQPLSILILVGMAYVFGLYLGVFIESSVHKRKN